MTTILIVLQVFIIAMLVVVILLQKTGSDGLSGLAGGGSGVISSRAAGNFFSKLTAIFAAAFMLNSLILAKIETRHTIASQKLLEQVINEQSIKAQGINTDEDDITTAVPEAPAAR